MLRGYLVLQVLEGEEEITKSLARRSSGGDGIKCGDGSILLRFAMPGQSVRCEPYRVDIAFLLHRNSGA